jgi:UDP-N-acetyl-2-amino-2-deoxyglucuronate dehydrogenase
MIRVALVGCGRIAQRHAGLLAGDQIAGAKLAAVCDVDETRAGNLAQAHSVPAFHDMHEMMKAARPDAVAVLTPSGLHARHVIELAPYGAHIIVEKPMALRLDDADRMIEACDRAGIKLFVVKQNRFNLPVLKLREALESGRFGKLVLGTVRVRWCRPQAYYNQDTWRGTWALDGGVLANQASHHVDLLEWMMGDVDSVFARGSTALVDIECEDTAAAILRFRNGALGIIEATTATRPTDLEGSISILGEKGTVEIGGFAVNQLTTWRFEPEIEGDRTVIGQYSTNPPNVYGFGHKAYYDHVVAGIQTDRSQLVDGIAGRRSLELIVAMYESMETGREVALRFHPERCQLGGPCD